MIAVPLKNLPIRFCMYQRCLWMSPGWYIKSAHDITSDARRGRSSAGSDLGASHKSLIQSEPVALDLAHPHKLWSWRANGAEKWNHFGHRLLLPPFFRRAHRPRRCLSRILRRLLREAYFWPVPACTKIPADWIFIFLKFRLPKIFSEIILAIGCCCLHSSGARTDQDAACLVSFVVFLGRLISDPCPPARKSRRR